MSAAAEFVECRLSQSLSSVGCRRVCRLSAVGCRKVCRVSAGAKFPSLGLCTVYRVSAAAKFTESRLMQCLRRVMGLCSNQLSRHIYYARPLCLGDSRTPLRRPILRRVMHGTLIEELLGFIERDLRRTYTTLKELDE